MRKSHSIIVTVAIVGIGASATLRSHSPRQNSTSRSPMRITFLGYTNDPVGTSFARFSVSNHSCYYLELDGYLPIRIDSGQRQIQSSRYRPLAKSVPVPMRRTATCDLPAAFLPDGERWAVVFGARRKGLRQRWDMFKENLSQHKLSVSGEYIESVGYWNY
jgi:hypothetical protein